MSQKARTSYHENFDLKDITENKILSYCKTTFFPTRQNLQNKNYFRGNCKIIRTVRNLEMKTNHDFLINPNISMIKFIRQ